MTEEKMVITTDEGTFVIDARPLVVVKRPQPPQETPPEEE